MNRLTDLPESEILMKYLPTGSLNYVVGLIDSSSCHLKIVPKRKTKHGDFRRLPNGKAQITVNAEGNPYRFLITLIHEYAHYRVYQETMRAKPHGHIWKSYFQRTMLPLLHPGIFPDSILSPLANHMKNPMASSDRDLQLSLALRKYDKNADKSLIFELPLASKFSYNNRVFVKGEKKRKRFECTEVLTHKRYVFHPHAEVDLIK